MNHEESKCLFEVEKVFEWDKWRKEIPYLEFPQDWLVRAIPPFHVGIIRYNIKHKEIPDSHVSIYLDCYDRAGFVGQPYWEIYPHEGDCFRCLMAETDKLIEAINQSFEEQKKQHDPTE